jgi:hypothetical protein
MGVLKSATISTLLARSICRPFRALRWVDGPRVETGLKPWAESSSPFGAKNLPYSFLQRAKQRAQGKRWAGLETSKLLPAV